MTSNVTPPREAPARFREGGVTLMADDRQIAIADFRRSMKWIAIIAVLMVVGALFYMRLYGPLNATTVIATTLGVFFSVLLGCGLFAAAFFSDKSGLDQQVANATRPEREHGPGQDSTRGRIP